MIHTYIDELAKHFNTSTFFTKTAGLIKVLSVKNNGQVKKFPASLKVYQNNLCTVLSDYVDLIPNSGEKAIVYFELDQSAIHVKKNITLFSGEITSVIWYNSELLPTENLDKLLFLTVSGLLRDFKTDDALFIASKLKITQEPLKQPFLKFSYSETDTQYTTHPFGFKTYSIRYSFCTKNC
tara:strand:+ start:19234 stop:19776 length:543 start_codon:yes stop_codon:yes gene_type:complete